MNSTARATDALILNKGDKAPYYGILSPVDYIKALEINSAKADFYKSELNKNKDCLPELSSLTPDSTVGYVIEGSMMGFLIGVIVTMVVIKH